jgi:hypothetical protein
MPQLNSQPRRSPFHSRQLFLALAAVAFLCAHASGQGCAPAAFKVGRTYAAGRSPSSLASADFNNDGSIDLLTANSLSGEISVLYGDGEGAFAPPLSISVGQSPVAAAGDFNNDAKQDIVVGYGNGTRTVAVLFGDGAGNFGAPSAVATIRGVLELATGDFNGDGKQDIASANGDAATVSFLLGNGAGGFAAPVNVTVASNLSYLAVGDFNGDNVSDIVVAAHFSDWLVAVIPGNTSGVFHTSQVLTATWQPLDVAVGDFDGDSKLDVAVSESFSTPLHGVEVMLGDGAGGLVKKSWNFTGYNPTGIAVADFNADSKPDIAATVTDGGVVGLLQNIGGGNFAGVRWFGAGSVPMAIVAGDIDKDGKVDLAVANAGSGDISVIRGEGGMSLASSKTFTSGVTDFDVADFNGDNYPDIIVLGGGGNFFQREVDLYLSDKSGGVQMSAQNIAAQFPSSVLARDFNNDGKQDALVSTTFGRTLSFFPGDGAGNFVSIKNTTTDGPVTDMAAADFNGDGKLDVALAYDPTASQATKITFMLGDGAGGFTVAPTPSITLTAPASSIVAADLNGDGKADVAAALNTPLNLQSNNVSVILGDGAGNFAHAPYSPLSAGNGPVHITAADVNKDLSTDLVVTNSQSLALLLSDGSGGFAAAKNFPVNGNPLSATVADFNLDGNPDVAFARRTGPIGGGVYPGDVGVMAGDGMGGLLAPAFFQAGGGTKGIAAADFDQDGRSDLAVTSTFISSSVTSILLNSYAPQPCLSVADVTIGESDFGQGSAVFKIQLSEPSAQAVKVNYATAGVTAVAGQDFQSRSGRLTFQPGETEKFISVPIYGDALNEDDETFDFKLSSPAHAVVGTGKAVGTIINDDPLPSFSVNDVTVTEGTFGGSTAVFKVQLSAPSGKNVSVAYSTVGGTATDIKDFQTIGGATVGIPAGQTSANVSVFIVGDDIHETDETFFFVLSSPVNATIGDGQGQGTIKDDDRVPDAFVEGGFQFEGTGGQTGLAFTVRLSNPSSQIVTIDYATADSTATVAGGDYAPATGTLTFASENETIKTITVMVNGDTVDETDESFFLNVSNPVNVSLLNTQATGNIFDDDGPTITINDVNVNEGNSGTTDATFTITLSAPSPQNLGVNFSTANITALFNEDYQRRTNGFVSVPAGSTSATFVIRVNGDTTVEPDESFFVNLSNPSGGTLADTQGVCVILDDDEAHVQFTSQSYNVSEGEESKVLVNVTRTGDTSGAVTFDYSTSPATASDRSDYTTALGTIRFAPGETQKSIPVLIANDALAEGPETFNVTLGNASGGKLRAPLGTVVTIADNDATSGPSPVGDAAFDADFFVRQHYADFLSREPDISGLAFWRDQIESCGANTQCREVRKINVSAAFFLSIEFQETGYLAYRTYKTAYGDATSPNVSGTVPFIRFSEFLPDAQRIGRDLVVGRPGWEQLLESNKAAYALEFVQRTRFNIAFPQTLAPAEFVDKLNANAGGVLNDSERTNLINELTSDNTNAGRASVLRKVAEDSDLRVNEKNRAFVLMQYYGYMRRNPDDPQDTDFRGWKFWLDKLNQFGGNFVSAEMVKAFITSDEYRHRFGQ